MSRIQTSGHYEHQVSGKVSYLTPKWITDLLGPFDLDPCAATPRPWDIAKVNYTEEDNGLTQPWRGFVWLNPPYGKSNGMDKFIDKLADHKAGGIALINATTQTKIWHEKIFPKADSFLFLRGRISFLHNTGIPTEGTFDNPVFIAFGEKATKRLRRMINKGHFILNTKFKSMHEN